MRRINNRKTKNKKYKKIEANKTKDDRKRKLNINRIKVTVINNPVEKAITDYNKSNPENKMNCACDIKTITRITLNFLRHRFTNYEIEIARLGLCPKRNNLFAFKKDTNSYILRRYGTNFIEEEVEKLREIQHLCYT